MSVFVEILKDQWFFSRVVLPTSGHLTAHRDDFDCTIG